MSTADARVRASERWLQAGFASIVAAGVATGWLFGPKQWRDFDLVYALGLPVCVAALCTHALLGRTEYRPWFVSLQLVALMATLACHPHVRSLSAVSLTAGVLAIVASFCGRKYSTVVCTLVCSVSISASLLIPLLRQG